MKHFIPALVLLAACGPTTPEVAPDPGPPPPPENTFVHQAVQDTTPRVTGIGGIFFETEDPAALNAWYGQHLGLAIDPYGSPFEFRNANDPDEVNYLRWAPAAQNTEYFAPSTTGVMINYRVHNLEALVRNLEAVGVEMLDSMMVVDYGKFIHFMDPQGNKVELWEPVDAVLTEMGGETTK